MLFTAPVKLHINEDVADLPFIVRFMHSPANKSEVKYTDKNGKEKTKYKEHRQRTCQCQIYAISPQSLCSLSNEIETKTFGKVYETPIVGASVGFISEPGFTYIKAYGRQASFERALRALIRKDTNESGNCWFTEAFYNLGYSFTGATFETAMKALRARHPHGVAANDAVRKLYGKSKRSK